MPDQDVTTAVVAVRNAYGEANGWRDRAGLRPCLAHSPVPAPEAA
jgi:hypothetical protein